jgi:hypothetical protein
MTPAEMVRILTSNIETARAVMEDGPVGYVLTTGDHVHFIRDLGSTLQLGDPLDDDVAVYTTHARAVVAQRYWNSKLTERDTFNAVAIRLRREALVGYIEVQQRTLKVLLEMGATQ